MDRVTAGSIAVLAHVSTPGFGTTIAMGLLFAGLCAAVGAWWFSGDERPRVRRVAPIGLGVVAFGCLGFATVMPFIIHPGPSFVRPSSTAHVEILSPSAGEVIDGDPATVHVALRLYGGRIVSLTSTDLVPNEGHIHVMLDGRLLSMTGLEATIIALPGEHTLQVEFVATDHGPFKPPVSASVMFSVRA